MAPWIRWKNRHRIQMRRLKNQMAIVAGIPPALIVTHDENDIGSVVCDPWSVRSLDHSPQICLHGLCVDYLTLQIAIQVILLADFGFELNDLLTIANLAWSAEGRFNAYLIKFTVLPVDIHLEATSGAQSLDVS